MMNFVLQKWWTLNDWLWSRSRLRCYAAHAGSARWAAPDCCVVSAQAILTPLLVFRGRFRATAWGLQRSAANCTMNGRCFNGKLSFFRGDSPLNWEISAFSMASSEEGGHSMRNLQRSHRRTGPLHRWSVAEALACFQQSAANFYILELLLRGCLWYQAHSRRSQGTGAERQWKMVKRCGFVLFYGVFVLFYGVFILLRIWCFGTVFMLLYTVLWCFGTV